MWGETVGPELTIFRPRSCGLPDPYRGCRRVSPVHHVRFVVLASRAPDGRAPNVAHAAGLIRLWLLWRRRSLVRGCPSPCVWRGHPSSPRITPLRCSSPRQTGTCRGGGVDQTVGKAPLLPSAGTVSRGVASLTRESLVESITGLGQRGRLPPAARSLPWCASTCHRFARRVPCACPTAVRVHPSCCCMRTSFLDGSARTPPRTRRRCRDRRSQASFTCVCVRPVPAGPPRAPSPPCTTPRASTLPWWCPRTTRRSAWA